MAKSSISSRTSAPKAGSTPRTSKAAKAKAPGPKRSAIARQPPALARQNARRVTSATRSAPKATKPAPAKAAAKAPVARAKAQPEKSASKPRHAGKPTVVSGSLLKQGPLESSPLFEALSHAEQRAVRQAVNGRTTLLERSPRARDAAIFAAAASLAPHPVVVASPLASELFQQATALSGVDVVTLASFVDPTNVAAAKRRIARGGQLLVVLEPAQLLSPTLQAELSRPPSLVGVAAAHAASEHAHELSPALLSVREALSSFGVPVLATATATSARVVGQVAELIGASGEALVAGGELALERAAQVVRAGERKAVLFAAILSYGAPGIVLTATTQEADAVFAELSSRGVACVRAHGGMAPAERHAALTRFGEPREQLVLVTQSPHANASGLAGSLETNESLTSAPPRRDLRFVLHYQAPLSSEQLFEDLAWLPPGGHSLVLADTSDAALVQALLAQQRVKPAAIEAVAQALAQAPADKPTFADTLALRAGTSRRSAERVLCAFADRNLITRQNGQITRQVEPERLLAEGRLLSARFATLRAGDAARAELVAEYVTSRHGSAPSVSQTSPALELRHVRA